jgi:hypothetical protein
MHRHQLERRDAQALQMFDDRFGRHAGVLAAQMAGNIGMHEAHAANVRLVNEGLVRRVRRPPFAAPIEAGVGDHPQGSEGRTVPVIERKITLRISQLITEQLVGPGQVSPDGLGIRIEQQFIGIEAQPALGNIRSMHAIAVQLAGFHIRHVDVPSAVGALADADSPLVVSRCIEQTEFRCVRGLGKQRKIDAVTVPVRPPREGRPGRLVSPVVVIENYRHSGGDGCFRRPQVRTSDVLATHY